MTTTLHSLAISDLLQADPDLRIEAQNAQGVHFLALVIPRNLQACGLLFVKNAKFFQALEKALAEKKHLLPTLGLVVERGYLESLGQQNPPGWADIKTQVGVLLSSSKIDLTMAKLSAPFHHLKNHGLNDSVDGRQLGTASVDPSALIGQHVFLGQGVSIGKNVVIHPGAVIQARSSIGDGTEIFPNVTIYRDVVIGKNCRIHSGTVIGADGFGYHFHGGLHHKIWHTGGVVIGDDVEVGANSCIDQGTFAPTTVGAGTKIDNQVQVGHNCQLGKGVILCGQVAMAGSTVMEDYCVVGGGAGIGPDLHLGKGCQIAGMAGVNCDWPAGSIVSGHPARPLKEWLRGLAYVRKMSLTKSEEKS